MTRRLFGGDGLSRRAFIGAAGALGLSWGVTRYVFDISWRPVPGLLAIGALLTALLVVAVGVLASADVLRKKPLTTLRAE